jgi:hypothetical protein
VVPGKPEESYLVAKLRGSEGIAGARMPLDEDALPEARVAAVEAWIRDLGDDGPRGGGKDTKRPAGRKPFHGTHQNMLPTTTTLGKRTLQFRIDHRFGRIGQERGAFGTDVGAIMSLQLAYGILDGWDVMLRRSNSHKDWELGTKYIPVRQEAGMPLSFGAYASMEWLRDFDVANQLTGNAMLMLSRLWFDRWSTMLAVGWHFNTNHNTRVIVDGGNGPVRVRDTRDTLTVGLASTVWLDKKRAWGLDLEYWLPIPDRRQPTYIFHYVGGDATAKDQVPVGSWTLGGSYRTAKHFFQVFFTNNREIHTNVAAPGAQSDNPFSTPGVESKNPFYHLNFFLGFNLARRFSL